VEGRRFGTGAAWLADVDVHVVQPYQARKAYRCPGCHRDIPSGTGHVVVLPREAPDLRRHWHKGCWAAECRRTIGPAAASRQDGTADPRDGR
jgi:hypothetical protein